MIKFLLFQFCIFPIISFAQITITQSDFPLVGESWKSYIDESPNSMTLTPADSIAQIWDYSNAFSNLDSSIVVFESPSQVYGSASFPLADYGWNFTSPPNLFNQGSFFRNMPDGLYLIGYNYNEPGNITVETIQPDKEQKPQED